MVDGVKSLPKKMLETGKNIVKGVWEGISKAKDAFKKKVKDFFGGIGDWAKEKLKINSPSKVMEEEVGQQITAGVAKGISDKQSDVDSSMERLTDGVLTPAAQMTKKMGEESTAAGNAMAGNLDKLLSTVPGIMTNTVSAAMKAMAQFSKQMGDTAAKASSSFASSMAKGIASMQSAMGSAGKNLVAGLWQGISGEAGWLYKSVTNFASGIVRNIKSTLGIHSPSRVMRDEIGKNLTLGIGEGITRNARAVYDAMQGVLDRLVSDAADAKISVGAGAAGLRGGGAPEQKNGGNTYNFYQTNNSPKALSRLDIYRQSKNALRHAAAMGR